MLLRIQDDAKTVWNMPLIGGAEPAVIHSNNQEEKKEGKLQVKEDIAEGEKKEKPEVKKVVKQEESRQESKHSEQSFILAQEESAI